MQQLCKWSIAIVVAALPVLAGAGEPVFLFLRDGKLVHPLAVVDRGHVVPLDVYGDNDLRYRLPGSRERGAGIDGMVLNGYDEGVADGPWSLRVHEDPLELDDSAPFVVAEPAEPSAGSVLSTRPLSSAGASAPASLADRRAALRNLRQLLARQHLPRAASARLLAEAAVRRVPVRRGERPLLVLHGSTDLDDGGRAASLSKVFSYLLVLEWRGGHYTTALRRSYRGGAVCGQTAWDYVTHADIDGDGIDELVVQPRGWESLDPLKVIAKRHGAGALARVCAGDRRRMLACSTLRCPKRRRLTGAWRRARRGPRVQHAASTVSYGGGPTVRAAPALLRSGTPAWGDALS